MDLLSFELSFDFKIASSVNCRKDCKTTLQRSWITSLMPSLQVYFTLACGVERVL